VHPVGLGHLALLDPRRVQVVFCLFPYLFWLATEKKAGDRHDPRASIRTASKLLPVFSGKAVGWPKRKCREYSAHHARVMIATACSGNSRGSTAGVQDKTRCSLWMTAVDPGVPPDLVLPGSLQVYVDTFERKRFHGPVNCNRNFRT